jgi:hypothetical protein
MICNTNDGRRTPASDEAGYICPRCEQSQAHLLDDDDDLDGRSDARHLTILAIDVDE